MTKETVAETNALMRAFDQSGKIGEHEIGVVDPHDAELRLERGEGIVGDLRLAALTAARKVDLPALGNPINPTSAISFSLS